MSSFLDAISSHPGTSILLAVFITMNTAILSDGLSKIGKK